MSKKILITLTKKEKETIDKKLVKPLEKKGYEVIVVYENAALSEEKIIEKIKDVDGYIVGLEKVTEKVLNSANNLKVVCKFGVGTDNIDKKSAAEKNVRVTNCPGLNSNSVAELVLGIIFCLSRDITFLDNKMKDDLWISSMGTEVTGKKLGIIGLGNIGKCLVKIIQGLNMDVMVYDLFKDEEFAEKYNLEYVELDKIIKESDFISLHIPINKATRDLISENELKAMKKNAFLINTARGGVVNEEALLKAIEDKEIAGAALDAFINEPPVGSALVKHERVIALPHIGAATYEATERIAQYSMQNVVNVIEGKEPLSEVK
ncbi:phosphoglycerate dehydrogenase [Halocella sp. SP3-1]|uniref:phosphoglycerate dehydrogenase n=1 Tax=Halocella sp. SP3-1 TaxID=2382161 RepID=UPI000F74C26D|nr:phosphoglycerate dehydrogenase [Halocella sp. SP3-1]AZO93300.1 hydroxyacid dehydrogenase [Halocella sp. SP3-1]